MRGGVLIPQVSERSNRASDGCSQRAVVLGHKEGTKWIADLQVPAMI
jgi:hypothetical protein